MYIEKVSHSTYLSHRRPHPFRSGCPNIRLHKYTRNRYPCHCMYHRSDMGSISIRRNFLHNFVLALQMVWKKNKTKIKNDSQAYGAIWCTTNRINVQVHVLWIMVLGFYCVYLVVDWRRLGRALNVLSFFLPFFFCAYI